MILKNSQRVLIIFLTFVITCTSSINLYASEINRQELSSKDIMISESDTTTNNKIEEEILTKQITTSYTALDLVDTTSPALDLVNPLLLQTSSKDVIVTAGKSIEHPTFIGLNVTISSSIESKGEVGYFTFKAPYKGDYKITTVGIANVTGMHTYLYKKGNSLHSNSTYFNKNSTNSSVIDVTLEPGEYILKVFGYDSSSVGDYALKITNTEEDDYPDALETSRKINTEQAYDATINYRNDVDCFEFNISYTGDYKITLVGKKDVSGLYMYLYKKTSDSYPTSPHANRHYANYSNSGVISLDTTLPPGDYAIKIWGYNASVVGDYIFRVENKGIKDDYPDTLETAHEIKTDQVHNATINYRGDVDCFEFKIPYSGDYKITLVGNKDVSGLYMYLYKKTSDSYPTSSHANGHYANYSNDGVINLDKTLPPGEYAIKIWGYNTSVVGDYVFRVVSDSLKDNHSNTLETAQKIQKNKTYNSTINYRGDVDCFEFNVPYPGDYKITLAGNKDVSGLYMYVYKKTSNSYSTSPYLWGSYYNYLNNRVINLDKTLEPGDYAIRILGYNNNDVGDYLLRVSSNTLRDDHVDTIVDAHVLKINTIYKGLINYRGDIDCVAFDVKVAGRYVVSAYPDGQTPLTGMYGYLYKDGTSSSIKGDYFTSTTGIKRINMTVDLLPGKYILRFQEYSNPNIGSYGFYLRQENVEELDINLPVEEVPTFDDWIGKPLVNYFESIKSDDDFSNIYHHELPFRLGFMERNIYETIEVSENLIELNNATNIYNFYDTIKQMMKFATLIETGQITKDELIDLMKKTFKDSTYANIEYVVNHYEYFSWDYKMYSIDAYYLGARVFDVAKEVAQIALLAIAVEEFVAAKAAGLAGGGVGNNTKLYRVMSQGEYDSIIKNKGKFSDFDFAMEEKWFATTQQDAAKWGTKFYPDGNYRMIEIEVPTSSLSQMYYNPYLDSIGPAYCGGIDLLNSIMKILGVIK